MPRAVANKVAQGLAAPRGAVPQSYVPPAPSSAQNINTFFPNYVAPTGKANPGYGASIGGNPNAGSLSSYGGAPLPGLTSGMYGNATLDAGGNVARGADPNIVQSANGNPGYVAGTTTPSMGGVTPAAQNQLNALQGAIANASAGYGQPQYSQQQGYQNQLQNMMMPQPMGPAQRATAQALGNIQQNYQPQPLWLSSNNPQGAMYQGGQQGKGGSPGKGAGGGTPQGQWSQWAQPMQYQQYPQQGGKSTGGWK